MRAQMGRGRQAGFAWRGGRRFPKGNRYGRRGGKRGRQMDALGKKGDGARMIVVRRAGRGRVMRVTGVSGRMGGAFRRRRVQPGVKERRTARERKQHHQRGKQRRARGREEAGASFGGGWCGASLHKLRQGTIAESSSIPARFCRMGSGLVQSAPVCSMLAVTRDANPFGDGESVLFLPRPQREKRGQQCETWQRRRAAAIAGVVGGEIGVFVGGASAGGFGEGELHGGDGVAGG